MRTDRIRGKKYNYLNDIDKTKEPVVLKYKFYYYDKTSTTLVDQVHST